MERASSRDKIDWFTAEEVVCNSLSVGGLKSLTQQFLVLTAYSELRKTNLDLPKIDAMRIINKEYCYTKELRRVNEEVDKLSDEQFDSLISRLSHEQRRGYQHHFLGREVWDRFYQPVRESGVLKSRGYGRVLFG